MGRQLERTGSEPFLYNRKMAGVFRRNENTANASDALKRLIGDVAKSLLPLQGRVCGVPLWPGLDDGFTF